MSDYTMTHAKRDWVPEWLWWLAKETLPVRLIKRSPLVRVVAK